MKTETFTFEGSGRLPLPALLRIPDGPVRAVLQITHGMTEHIGRYDALAEALTACGIAVCGFDLRGHGNNPGDPACASFGAGGWMPRLRICTSFPTFLTRGFRIRRVFCSVSRSVRSLFGNT